jgi:hypothetical protein
MGQQGRVFAVQLTLTELLIAVPLMSLGIGTAFAGARTTLAVMAGLVMLVLLLAEVDRLRTSRRGAALARLEVAPVEVSAAGASGG